MQGSKIGYFILTSFEFFNDGFDPDETLIKALFRSIGRLKTLSWN